jgi:hypothetical protein
MTTQWIIGWWNLIFLVPFGLALTYLGVYTLSGWTFGDADADADIDHDIDADVDHDIDADLHADVDADVDADADADVDAHVDADADHDVDSDADHDADSDSDHDADDAPAWLTLISWLGVGRIPLSVLLMLLLMSWGFAGFVTNAFLQERGFADWQLAIFSAPVAMIASTLFTRMFARLIARYFPTTSAPVMRRHQLLGSVGEAILPIDDNFGMAAVRNDHGQLYQVSCRAEVGSIPTGAKVQLVAYTAKNQTFHVRPYPSAAATLGAHAHAAVQDQEGR